MYCSFFHCLTAITIILCIALSFIAHSDRNMACFISSPNGVFCDIGWQCDIGVSVTLDGSVTLCGCVTLGFCATLDANI